MSDMEKAQGAQLWAQTNQTMGKPVTTEDEIREHWLGLEPLTEEQKQAIADEAAEKVAQQQEAMGGRPEDKEDVKTLRAMEAALERGDREALGELLGLGDLPGHEFHGNQWTSGSGGTIKRLSPGRYETEHHSIDKTPDGWRWSAKQDPSTGGEWRSTLREAKLDLEDFLKIKLRLAEGVNTLSSLEAAIEADDLEGIAGLLDV
jgi:hypothetical protein